MTVDPGRERVITAWHEAGHVVVGQVCDLVVVEAAIIPRVQQARLGRGFLGHTNVLSVPDPSREQVEHHCVVVLAGREAERLAPAVSRPYRVPGHEALVSAWLAEDAAVTGPTPDNWTWPSPLDIPDESDLAVVLAELARLHPAVPSLQSAHLDYLIAWARTLTAEMAEAIAAVAGALLDRDRVGQVELADLFVAHNVASRY